MSTAKPATIKKFLDVTVTASEGVAKFFLGRNNNKLTNAINDYYSNQHLAADIISVEGQAKKTLVVNAALQQVFDRYKDPRPDSIGNPIIGLDGTMEYLTDLGYEPEDLIVLTIAEFLESPGEGVFKQEQFLNNWTKVGCNTISAQRNYIESTLRTKFTTSKDYYKEVYHFTYKFILEKDQKNLPLETAVAYWRLMLPTHLQPQLERFVEFLESEEIETITKDQWDMLYPFLEEYNKDSKLSNYDESQSWPVLIDEFVEYLDEKGELQ